jgi:hypothetical protein
LYALGNPVRFRDPSGHFTCEGDENCQETIEYWLKILEEQGGDIGAELVGLFQIKDVIFSSDGWSIMMLQDAIHIQIVEDGSLGGGVLAQTEHQTIRLTHGLLEQAKQGGDNLLFSVATFGHEVKHLQTAGSLHAEVEAWDVQYQLYEAMGLSDRHSDDARVLSAEYVHMELVGASDYDLMHSALADQYSGMPLYYGLWYADPLVRGWNEGKHYLNGRIDQLCTNLAEWWSSKVPR